MIMSLSNLALTTYLMIKEHYTNLQNLIQI